MREIRTSGLMSGKGKRNAHAKPRLSLTLLEARHRLLRLAWENGDFVDEACRQASLQDYKDLYAQFSIRLSQLDDSVFIPTSIDATHTRDLFTKASAKASYIGSFPVEQLPKEFGDARRILGMASPVAFMFRAMVLPTVDYAKEIESGLRNAMRNGTCAGNNGKILSRLELGALFSDTVTIHNQAFRGMYRPVAESSARSRAAQIALPTTIAVFDKGLRDFIDTITKTNDVVAAATVAEETSKHSFSWQLIPSDLLVKDLGNLANERRSSSPQDVFKKMILTRSTLDPYAIQYPNMNPYTLESEGVPHASIVDDIRRKIEIQASQPDAITRAGIF